MSKKITNTLTRWHKIAERIKGALNDRRQEVLGALQGGNSVDADTFSVRSNVLAEKASKALTEGMADVLRLQDALFYVRKELARANVQFLVSDLLNQMERAKQEMNFLEECIVAAGGKLSIEEMHNLASRRQAQPAPQTVYGHGREQFSVSLVSTEQLDELKAKRDAARRSVNGLADKVADANANKLTLELDDIVVEVLGLSAE